MKNVAIGINSEQVWSRMFLKLALSCFEGWAKEMAPQFRGLKRFKEKYDMLKSAKTEFPQDNTLYVGK
jgi:hypothetical protein